MAATPPSRRRRLLGRRAVVAIVMATPLVATLLVATLPTTAGAQDDPTPEPIEVTAVSPWVEPTGTFRVTIALAPTVPVDATLSYTVHQRLRASSRQTLRAAVDAVADGAASGPNLRNRVSTPVAGLAAAPGGIALDIPLRDEQGGGSGELLQNAGIHPVTLTLADAGGDEIDEQVVFLNRLPADISTAAPNQVSVTLVVPVGSGPAVALDGSTQLSVPARAEISSATEMLTEVPEAPLTLALRPDTLDGIARSTNPEDLRFLDSLQSASFAGTIARIPYVRTDTAGLVAAGAGNEAARQLDVGQAVLAATTGRVPSTSDSFDDSIDLQSLPLVQSRGARRVVLPPDRFELAEGVPSEAATTAAVAIEGEEGLTGTAYDSGISVRMTESAGSPGYRAHVVTTDLMAAWFSAAEEPDVRFPGPASVILVPPSTDPAVVRALLPSLRSDGPLSPDPAAVPTAAGNDGDQELRARLTPRATDDVSAMVDGAKLTRSRIAGYETMVGAGDPEVPLWTTLVDQTFSRDMAAEDRNAVHQSVRAQIDSRLAAIELPGRGAVRPHRRRRHDPAALPERDGSYRHAPGRPAVATARVPRGRHPADRARTGGHRDRSRRLGPGPRRVAAADRRPVSGLLDRRRFDVRRRQLVAHLRRRDRAVDPLDPRPAHLVGEDPSTSPARRVEELGPTPGGRPSRTTPRQRTTPTATDSTDSTDSTDGTDTTRRHRPTAGPRSWRRPSR